MNHNFKIANVDTDALMFCKEDMSPFSDQEQQDLLDELNELYPPLIKFAHDGYFKDVLIVRAKNYCLNDGKKVKIKGSGLKVTNKEPALKEFTNRFIQLLMSDQQDKIVDMYHEYVKEIMNLKDIHRWASKKTITSKVLDAERTTEAKVLAAIEDEEYQEGDKMFFYFDKDENLKLSSNWTNDHHVDRMLEKLYKCTKTFDLVFDNTLFLNYKLKRNKAALASLTTV